MRFKPWMLAVALQGLELQPRRGFDPELGLDKHFYDQAKDAGQERSGSRDGRSYQISVFDGMTMEQQDRMLAADAQGAADRAGRASAQLADAWKAGDVATVEQIVQAELKAEPVIYQRLLVDRNKNWLPKIEALFGAAAATRWSCVGARAPGRPRRRGRDAQSEGLHGRAVVASTRATSADQRAAESCATASWRCASRIDAPRSLSGRARTPARSRAQLAVPGDEVQ